VRDYDDFKVDIYSVRQKVKKIASKNPPPKKCNIFTPVFREIFFSMLPVYIYTYLPIFDDLS